MTQAWACMRACTIMCALHTVLLLQLATAQELCRYANDGECDEPAYCNYGTDSTDCGGSAPGSTSTAVSCAYANDGVCKSSGRVPRLHDPSWLHKSCNCTILLILRKLQNNTDWQGTQPFLTLAFLLNPAASLHHFAAGDEPQMCVSGTDGSDCTSAAPAPESDAGCQETLGTDGSSCSDYIRAGAASCAAMIGYGYDCSCTCSTGTSSEDSVPAAGGRGDTTVEGDDCAGVWHPPCPLLPAAGSGQSGPSCNVYSHDGICINVNACIGTPHPGFCPGAADIQCCVGMAASDSPSSSTDFPDSCTPWHPPCDLSFGQPVLGSDTCMEQVLADGGACADYVAAGMDCDTAVYVDAMDCSCTCGGSALETAGDSNDATTESSRCAQLAQRTTDACCSGGQCVNTNPSPGQQWTPPVCTSRCANTFLPFYSSCGTLLGDYTDLAGFETKCAEATSPTPRCAEMVDENGMSCHEYATEYGQDCASLVNSYGIDCSCAFLLIRVSILSFLSTTCDELLAKPQALVANATHPTKHAEMLVAIQQVGVYAHAKAKAGATRSRRCQTC
jgi:hypothetical protein